MKRRTRSIIRRLARVQSLARTDAKRRGQGAKAARLKAKVEALRGLLNA